MNLLAVIRPLRRALAWVAWGASCGAALAQEATNLPPTITRQPVDAVAGVGESILLSAEVAGTPPFSLQWYSLGGAIPGATNTTLLLTNLSTTNRGNYALFVTNSFGSTNTANATLDVTESPARSVQNGAAYLDGEQAAVPLHFLANGTEHAVAFSVSFTNSAFTNAVFTSALANATVAVTSTNLNGGQTGALGISLTLPDNEVFPAASVLLGTLRFDRLPERGLLDGRVTFTTNPVAPAALTVSNTPLAVATSPLPQFRRLGGAPALNFQTGLFEQRIELANATDGVFTNVNVLVFELGRDSFTNTIRLFNGVTTLRIDTDLDGDPDLDVGYDCVTTNQAPCAAGTTDCDCSINPDIDGDGIVDAAPAVSIANLQPGEARQLTMEYYVGDLSTVPAPRYALRLTPSLPFSTSQITTPITSTINRPTPGGLMLEFPTTRTNRYYIQYSSVANDWSNTNLVKLARPGVTGNGSRLQWIDYGPPKTDPLGTNTTRFYRVLEGF